MNNEIKTIGVLTSGGDAPGMNAAIRGVVRAGLACGKKAIGIKRGFQGLLDKDFIEMDGKCVSETIQKGGTILYTARCEEFFHLEGQNLLAQQLVEGLPEKVF